MVLVKRTWSKKSQISEHTELLDIWDTGSHIYERWPNGDEYYWRIISREETKSGFHELLEKQPLWQTPGRVLRRERIPLQHQSDSEFQLGEWSVEQVVENVSSMKEERIGQRHTYKKNTSSQKIERGQRGPQVKVQLPNS
jgi:hypothetical protein